MNQRAGSKDISAVVTCMNRRERLVNMLPRVLDQPQVTEIVVVDWGSRDSIDSIRSEIRDPRLRLVIVAGIDEWQPASAANIGMRFARGTFICRLDVDYLLEPSCFSKIEYDEQSFVRGDRQLAQNEDEVALSGFLLAHRSAIAAVNGYNERLRGWGYEDIDIHERLSRAGYNASALDFSLVRHLPHDDRMRIENNRGSHRWLNHAKNMLFSERAPWTTADSQSVYEVQEVDVQLIHCRRLSGPEPRYPEVERECMRTVTEVYARAALRQLVDNAGGTLWGYSIEEMLEWRSEAAPSGIKYLAWRVLQEARELRFAISQLRKSIGAPRFH